MSRDLVSLVSHGGEIWYTYHSNHKPRWLPNRLPNLYNFESWCGYVASQIPSQLDQVLSWFKPISFHSLWRDLIKPSHNRHCYSWPHNIGLLCWDLRSKISDDSWTFLSYSRSPLIPPMKSKFPCSSLGAFHCNTEVHFPESNQFNWALGKHSETHFHIYCLQLQYFYGIIHVSNHFLKLLSLPSGTIGACKRCWS